MRARGHRDSPLLLGIPNEEGPKVLASNIRLLGKHGNRRVHQWRQRSMPGSRLRDRLYPISLPFIHRSARGNVVVSSGADGVRAWDIKNSRNAISGPFPLDFAEALRAWESIDAPNRLKHLSSLIDIKSFDSPPRSQMPPMSSLSSDAWTGPSISSGAFHKLLPLLCFLPSV